MPARNYSITEPHPSVPASNYYLSGRGGAGNMTRVSAQTVSAGPDATGPAARVAIPTHSSDAYFAAGRGGAGNMHREKERAIFSFDEELERQARLMNHQAPVYHVGRGGAGNVDGSLETARRSSHSSSDSTSSAESVRRSMDSAWNRVRGVVSRH
ncbi:hypothetical protein FKW77_005598 [Venturia effusa]|uniref:Uncharacterized protein n=1 Tax=Venturia effusa TaxID=50376 RepID=A0A517L5E4_9PEZI|nr:hypothetical protein FKW77_005598 [Venturia effusa]